MFPAIGSYTGCKNIELEFRYTSKDIWNRSVEELAKVARTLGYEPVKGCPISFTKEILFRKIGTWNKLYIMRRQRSQYLKKKWGYLNKDGVKSLIDCYRSKKFKETPYLRKKSEIARESWQSLPLSQKNAKR